LKKQQNAQVAARIQIGWSECYGGTEFRDRRRWPVFA